MMRDDDLAERGAALVARLEGREEATDDRQHVDDGHDDAGDVAAAEQPARDRELDDAEEHDDDAEHEDQRVRWLLVRSVPLLLPLPAISDRRQHPEIK